MASALARIFSVIFFVFGSIVLILLVLVKRDIQIDTLLPILNAADLPLLGSGMLYSGTSLYASLTKNGKFSMGLALGIGIPLIILFGIFAYMNFGLPFAGI